MRLMKQYKEVFENLLLSKINRTFKKACVEARELIIALPESFIIYQPEKLLKIFTEKFIL